jgi:hypothetical protein
MTLYVFHNAGTVARQAQRPAINGYTPRTIIPLSEVQDAVVLYPCFLSANPTERVRGHHHFISEKMKGKMTTHAFQSTITDSTSASGNFHPPLRLPIVSPIKIHILSSATAKKW